VLLHEAEWPSKQQLQPKSEQQRKLNQAVNQGTKIGNYPKNCKNLLSSCDLPEVIKGI